MVFFNIPSIHEAYKDICQNLVFKQKEISAISDTRWACRYRTVKAIDDSYDAIETSLLFISKGDSRQRFEANGLLSTYKTCEFNISLKIFVKILSIIHVLHKSLQSEDSDLSAATDQILGTIRVLKALRNNLEWNIIWNSIDNNKSIPNKRIRTANINEDFVYNYVQTDNNLSIENLSEFYKSHLYFEVIDTLTNELERRFSKENLDLAKAVSGVFTANSLNSQPLINKYAKILKIDPLLTTNEIAILRNGFLHAP